MQFLDFSFRQAPSSRDFFSDLVRGGMIAGEDWLMQLGITDASIRMNNTKFPALFDLSSARLAASLCHVKALES
ncbi:MAG: hypothetical protein WBO12_04315 [Xanthobacteraceae bacterium]|jgi:hypothetical protein